MLIQLGIALSRGKPSLRIFDSSAGFRLPDGSVLSPDAALVLEERWQALSPQQRRGFPPLCPDLVVELASASDEGPRGITNLREKMDQYQANGARLGWLLLPEERAVEIWRGGQQGMAERLENASRLEGGELAEGLALELEEIWAV
ncbi:MAG: Uma2 family endonuclease [Cyanobium sp.]